MDKVREAIGLLNSMVLCGENHSKQSENVVKEALLELEQKVVFCVMDRQDKVFAIYGSSKRAEAIANQMEEKHDEHYYVSTWQIH
jgi:isoaspartyl peptidase/L-asparaginase-like protein (Ntn-hydrolase superfamily)